MGISKARIVSQSSINMIDSFISYQQKPHSLNVRSPSSICDSRPSSTMDLHKSLQGILPSKGFATSNIATTSDFSDLKSNSDTSEFIASKKMSDSLDGIVFSEDRCNHCGALLTEVYNF